MREKESLALEMEDENGEIRKMGNPAENRR